MKSVPVACTRFALLLMLPCALAQAQLYWDANRLEFKATIEQTNILARFTFKNVSTNTIHFLDLKSSCGCTTAMIEKKAYQPGESGFLTANFIFGQRVGLQEKTILVQTDAPRSATTLLKLKVDIPEILKINPPFVSWKVGEAPTPKEIVVTAAEGLQLGIDNVESSNPRFSVELKPVRKRESYVIRVIPADTKAAGWSVLRIRTKSPVSRAFQAMAIIPEATNPLASMPVEAKN